MIRKLKETFYNMRTAKEIKDVEFVDFIKQGRMPHSVFYSKEDGSNILIPFAPETAKIFIMTIEQMKLDYFEHVSFDKFQSQVEEYCNFFNFVESVKEECLKIYHAKQENIKLRSQEIKRFDKPQNLW